MRLPKRLQPKVVVSVDSCNQSERTPGLPLNLIVLHSTESHNRPGTSDLAAIGSWFDNPAAQSSAHVCVDADGNSGKYVPATKKAWHCAGYNSASLGIEQIGYSAQGFNAWAGNDAELWEAARWIAEWSLRFNIPIRRAWVRSGSVIRSGVTTHKRLGTIGGNHGDPGRYPFRRVLRRARAIKKARS